MTVSHKKSKSGDYYINAMTAEDYYASRSEKEPPGVWHFSPGPDGRPALECFGEENGTVFSASSIGAFHDLCRGFNPANGSPLTQNSGSPKRTALHDFTFSAPKSFSVVWGLTQNEPLRAAIGQAQVDGVRTALNFLSEKGGYTRRGKDGHILERVGLVSALFEHGSSRENDMQLHTHGVVLNVCTRSDGTTGSIETKILMRWQGAAASLYHAHLAYAARKQGARVVMEGKIPELQDIPLHVREAFSKRRKAIIKRVEEAQGELGITQDVERASKGLLQKATIETRDAKNELTRAELQELWLKEGAALGYTEKQILEAFDFEPPAQLSDDHLREIAFKAIDELTETDAVFREPTLYTTVAVALCGQASTEDIVRTVEMAKAELITARRLDETRGEFETVYSTAKQLRCEQAILDMVDRKAAHGLAEEAVEKAIAARDKEIRQAVAQDLKRRGEDPLLATGLEQEQRDAIRHICLSRDAVSVLEGTAGAGKTFTIKSVGEIYSAAGYKVHGLSGAWTQALNLKKEANLDQGMAIAAWLAGLNTGKITLTEKSVVVLDEAGMVGTQEMRSVLAQAERVGCKVVLLGDTLQQTAISAGDALRLISSVVGSARLDTIRRQRSEEERQGVKDLFAGRGEQGFAAFKKGARVLAKDQVHPAMVADWLAAKKAAGNHLGGKGEIAKAAQSLLSGRRGEQGQPRIETQLMQATDRASVFELNRLAHDKLKAAGLLGQKSVQVQTMDSKDASDLVEFSVGDEIVFRRNNRKLRPTERDQAAEVFNRVKGIVVDIDSQDRLQILTEEGKKVTLDPRDTAWQQKDGEGLALQHAYCSTVYSGQGVTVDRTFNKDGLSLSRRSAGVMMSRHREEARIYIDREERYDAKMREADSMDWHHINQFNDEECMARMAKAWGRQSDKLNATDLEAWRNAQGEFLDPHAELAIEQIETALLHFDEIAASDEAEEVLPFQKAEWYEIDRLPEARSSLQHAERSALEEAGVQELARRGISSRVIADAKAQSMLDFDANGRPVFHGYRPNESAASGNRPVNQMDLDGRQVEGALRDRFPPILRGQPGAELAVVKTGLDGLALWTQADRANKPRPHILVASGNVRDATALRHVRDLVRESSAVTLHRSAQATDSAHRAAEAAIRKAGGTTLHVREAQPAEQLRLATIAQDLRETKTEQEKRKGLAPGH